MGVGYESGPSGGGKGAGRPGSQGSGDEAPAGSGMPGREGAGGRGESLIRDAQRGRPAPPPPAGLARLRRATAFSPWGVHGPHAAPFGGGRREPPRAAWRGGSAAGPFPVSRLRRRHASNSGSSFARAHPLRSRLPEPLARCPIVSYSLGSQGPKQDVMRVGGWAVRWKSAYVARRYAGGWVGGE